MIQAANLTTREASRLVGIPMMGEVEDIPLNGRKIVSLFTGAGGLDLGLRMAGFKTVWANEMMPLARMVYLLNNPGVPVDRANIRNITAAEIMVATGLGAGEVDLLAGSPPCSSFSTSGKRGKKWGQKTYYSKAVKQRTDDLFYEYIRILQGLMPKVFVAENVAGLAMMGAKNYLRDILRQMRGLGYYVACKLLDAQWLGVPQCRKRIFIIGVRHDLRVHPQFPRPQERRFFVPEVMPLVTHFHVSGLGRDRMPRGFRSAAGKCFPTITDHAYRMSRRAVLASNCRVILKDGSERRITIDEMKLLFTFPPDFELVGTERDQWERIARSVPPIMAKKIGDTLVNEVFTHVEG